MSTYNDTEIVLILLNRIHHWVPELVMLQLYIIGQDKLQGASAQLGRIAEMEDIIDTSWTCITWRRKTGHQNCDRENNTININDAEEAIQVIEHHLRALNIFKKALDIIFKEYTNWNHSLKNVHKNSMQSLARWCNDNLGPTEQECFV